jgi:hypothetical protein
LHELPSVLGAKRPVYGGFCPPAEPRSLLVTALQVALAVLLVRAFRIEEAFGFVTVAPLILVGFVVNAWLPLRFRAPFL